MLKEYILKHSQNDLFIQAAKYFVVGGVCTVIDFAILFVLTQYGSINYITSSAISFMSATVLNYYLCTVLIFKIRTVENRYKEFFYYMIITGVGLGFNTLIIWSFTKFVGFYYLFSKVIATFVTYWWNFLARKYFLHTER